MTDSDPQPDPEPETACEDRTVNEEHHALLRALQRKLRAQQTQLDELRTTHEQALKTIHDKLDEHDTQIGIATAGTTPQQQGKLERIREILMHATVSKTSGPRGVTLTTGEVAAAADSSRNTALRLMDEISANFEWATTENPGGPSPKQLKIRLDDRSATSLMTDVREHYRAVGKE